MQHSFPTINHRRPSLTFPFAELHFDVALQRLFVVACRRHLLLKELRQSWRKTRQSVRRPRVWCCVHDTNENILEPVACQRLRTCVATR